MANLTASNHMYCALIALVITAVAIPFNPGIPWFAWVGAFVLLLLVAEVLSVFLRAEDQGTQKSRQRNVSYFAVAAAVVLVLILVGWFIR